MRKARGSSLVLPAMLLVGCAHTGSPTVSRLEGDVVVRGPRISSGDWEDALDAAIDERAHPAAAEAIRSALAAGDVEGARALALADRGTDDVLVRAAVFDALVASGDASALEALVAAHRDERAFADEAARRAAALSPPLDAAIFAALACTPRFLPLALPVLLREQRGEVLGACLADAAPATIDERLAYAELALDRDAPELALRWADEAWSAGASTRALALRVRALDALGRDASSDRARLRAGTAGALTGP